jgi:CheY-like chemotaxis protein
MAEERKTILIVEDEPDTATYLSALLGDAGYDTVLAEDGEKALEIVKANRPLERLREVHLDPAACAGARGIRLQTDRQGADALPDPGSDRLVARPSALDDLSVRTLVEAAREQRP